MRPITHIRRALLPLAVLALLAGCDTNNAGGSLRDVAGSYSIARLYFDPDASGIVDANVLARLDSANTEIRLFSDGDALFFLEFAESGESVRTDLRITATSSLVRFSAVGGPDVQELMRILLPAEFSLDREGAGTLARDLVGVIANLDRYEEEGGVDNDVYEGLTAVRGTLSVELVRR
jgi:hypothetical protein